MKKILDLIRMDKIHSTMSAIALGGLEQRNTDYTISSAVENGRTGEQEHCGKQTQRQI